MNRQRQVLHLSKEPLTLDLLEQWLDGKGISIRRDVISHAVNVDGISEAYDRETLDNDLHIILHDALKGDYRCSASQVSDMIGVIAGKHRFNPVLEMLTAAQPWDGLDHERELRKILHLADTDRLSCVLLHKGLLQMLAMAKNELETAYGADGILVFTGPQGIGKTTLVRALAVKPELVKLGQYLDSRDKDTIRRCTSCWICEWGEVETTFKSDLERLKAFITAEIDQYRVPYGRRDQRFARRTSIIATCNSPRFLIDPSGSRRFWTIPVNEIDLDLLAQFDALQLWKQMEHELISNPQRFRLTKDEQTDLAKRNSEHEKPLKSQMEIEDILQEAQDNPSIYAWRYTTVSAFKGEHNTLTAYSVEQIAKALDRLGIEPKRKTLNGTQCRARFLPCYKWNAANKYA